MANSKVKARILTFREERLKNTLLERSVIALGNNTNFHVNAVSVKLLYLKCQNIQII